MRRLRTVILLLSFLSVLYALPATAAGNRLALVIGNDNYQHIPKLLKAVNDAKAMAKTLEELGFRVILGIDLTRREMVDKLQEFYLNIRTGDEVVIFYAGHGVEINDQNYLLPVDMRNVKPGHIFTVTKESFSAQDFIDIARERVAQVTILILDACRNNPFSAGGTRGLVGGTRGLAPIKGPEGTFVMYSAGDGEVALDRLDDNDTNPNSVFTRKLLPLLKRPGLSLTDIARTVRREVYALAQSRNRKQRPAYYDEILGDFYFKEAVVASATPPGAGGGASETAALRAPSAPSSEGERTNKAAEERLFWQSIENSQSTAPFKVYLSVYPNGMFKAEALAKIAALEAAAPAGAAAGPGAGGGAGAPSGHGAAGAPAPAAGPAPGRGGNAGSGGAGPAPGDGAAASTGGGAAGGAAAGATGTGAAGGAPAGGTSSDSSITRGISVPSGPVGERIKLRAAPKADARPPRLPHLPARPRLSGTLPLPSGPRQVIFPHSSREFLSEAEVMPLTCLKLWLARNEIYHRNGYCFRSRLGIQYFGNANCRTIDTDILSPLEKRNVELIKKWEAEKKCG